MSRSALLLLLLAACAHDDDRGNGDVIGPFTGRHRFVVDRLDVPTTTAQARALGDDLDNDDVFDNQTGIVIASLFGIGDGNTHGADSVASGAVASSVIMLADDLAFDDTVGVLYLGAEDGAATAAGGVLQGGIFASNRTRTTAAPGDAVVVLPVFQDSAPSALPIFGAEIDLVADGNGGFEGKLRGGLRSDDAFALVGEGLLAMIQARPQSHLSLARDVDTNHDSVLTAAEIADTNLIKTLLASDLTLFGEEALSFGVGFHIIPCDSGNCALSTPATTCFDRVRDGDETDIDCGGPTCGACAEAAVCAAPTDCQTAACDGGHCAAASCTDAVADGLESDLDCGGPCGGCPQGKRCFGGGDCLSGHCSGQFGEGTCQP